MVPSFRFSFVEGSTFYCTSHLYFENGKTGADVLTTLTLLYVEAVEGAFVHELSTK